MFFKTWKKQIATLLTISLLLPGSLTALAWGTDEIRNEDEAYIYDDTEDEASPSNQEMKGLRASENLTATSSNALLEAVKSFHQPIDFVDRNGDKITSGERSIPETQNSFPYLSQGEGRTKGNINLEEYEYVEKEYFLSGNANVYDLIDGSLATKSNADYVNRILVFLPENPEDFNGAVYVDILNASSKVDVPDIWRRSYDFFMKQGYVYIGITSKDVNVASLKKFDANRYQVLEWEDKGKAENGLIWDMLGQLGILIKQDSSPLLYESDYSGDIWTYLMGQSQSGWYVNTFSNQFGKANYVLEDAENIADLADVTGETHIYDGFFNVVGGMMDAPIATKQTDAGKMFQPANPSEVPFMLAVGENDYNPAPARADSDVPGDLYRHYVVAGASHSNKVFLPDPLDEIQLRAGRPAGEYPKYITDPITGKAHSLSDLNMDVYVNAALENLHQWASQGVEAPHGPSTDEIEGKTSGMSFLPERDEYGNMSTGIRSPQITVPVASYYGGANGAFNTDGGSMIYLDDAVLKELYGTLQNYVDQYETALDEMIHQNWILETDRALMMRLAQTQPVLGNPGRDNEAIETSMSQIPTQSLLSSKQAQAGPVSYGDEEYLLRGKANLYGVLSQNIIYLRRMRPLDYTNYARICVPDNFTGAVVIDLMFEGEEPKDVAAYMQKGQAYVGITADPAAAAALGGNWKISDKADAPRPESGLVWDIISQTISYVSQKESLTRASLSNRRTITLGIDENESDMIYTYKIVFGEFDGYKVKKEKIKEDAKAIPLNSLDPTVVPQITTDPPTPPNQKSSDGGSTGQANAGSWKQDAIGWWYLNPDGTWPASQWIQLPWNQTSDWYYFNEKGYMVTGWIQQEGNNYYLHPLSDGRMGHMYTGWRQIDQKWYYFNAESNGTKGSLFVNTTTPDGYPVDANGVYISETN